MHTGNLNYELWAQHTFPTRASSHLFTFTWLSLRITYFLLLSFTNILGLLNQISLSEYWCCFDKYLRFRAPRISIDSFIFKYHQISLPTTVRFYLCALLFNCFIKAKVKRDKIFFLCSMIIEYSCVDLCLWQLSIKRNIRLGDHIDCGSLDN